MAELGKVERPEVVLGNLPTQAREIQITGAASFKRGDVVVRDATGAFALASAAAATASGVPILGIMCDDVDVSAGDTVVTAMYVNGVFNHRDLQFAPGTTAYDLKDVMAALGMIVRDTKV